MSTSSAAQIEPLPGDRIRVLRVIARLNVGGPALHTVLLTERLPHDRYESRLVTGSHSSKHRLPQPSLQ